MIKERLINGEKVYDILNYDYEGDLGIICNILSAQYSLKILKKDQGPGTTIWTLKLKEDIDVFLINNSYGNFFKPIDETARCFFEKEAVMVGVLLY